MDDKLIEPSRLGPVSLLEIGNMDLFRLGSQSKRSTNLKKLQKVLFSTSSRSFAIKSPLTNTPVQAEG